MIRKIVVAPDSFKGTMSSVEICSLTEAVIKKHIREADVVSIPIADGGEGTVEAFHRILGGEIIEKEVTGPSGDPVNAFYLYLEDRSTAVIEMAAASGLPLSKGDDRAMKATSYGTGELMLDAALKGCSEIILGIGGSATTDGGLGILTALGAGFLDENGNAVTPDGYGLEKVSRIDDSGLTGALKDIRITVACDVRNPLYGPEGAAYVFAPQKGASASDVGRLDSGLKNLSRVISDYTGRDRSREPGMGAAGGVCISLGAFFDIGMRRGIDMILDAAGFDGAIEDADLIITGEGRIDSQSLQGKVPVGIAERAKKKGVPVIAVVGDVGDISDRLFETGITAVFSTNRRAVPWEEARLTSKEDYMFTVDSVIRALTAFK